MSPRVRAFLNKLLGNQGEREAARFLRGKGFRILFKQYRTTLGEIDLIARDGDTLVFVEVKARRLGTPAEAATPEKQRKLTLAALEFLKRYGLLEVSARFDVIAIVWPISGQNPAIEHIRNAFDAVGRGQMFR